MAKGNNLVNNMVSATPGAAAVFIAEPNEMDVLCSKDKSVAKHPGNLVFRERIEHGSTLYASTTSKQDKMKITRDIVSYMQTKYGARFLKQRRGDKNAWVEISDQLARDKVSHALRFNAKNASTATSVASKKSKKTVGRRQPSLDHYSSSSSHSSETNTLEEDEDISSSHHTHNLLGLTTTKRSDPSSRSPLELPVASIYLRQQHILGSLQHGGGVEVPVPLPVNTVLDFNEFQANSLLEDETTPSSPEFNTLRSEDLNELLRDPMFASTASTDEWDVVEQMVAC